MVKLSSLTRVVDISIKWNDEETLNLRVLPDQFTGRQLEAMSSIIKEHQDEDAVQFRTMCGFMADLIQWWDLLDEDDKPLEISEEGIFNTLPVTVVQRILQEIQTELSVNPQKPEP